jgi:cell division transport system ATP-binding protein
MRYGLGPEVLHDVSFALSPGSFHFLVGASGAGKSSLLKLLYLAERPSRGLLHIAGHEVSALPRNQLYRVRRRIGIVFQDFRLVPHLSAFDNVALPMRITGESEERVRSHATELLGWVGLGDRLDAPPSTLSGGEQQRVAIARAVIGRPSILLADEPTGNVDDSIAMRLLYLFEEMQKAGTTVVVATHNENLVSRFAYPALRIVGGRLDGDG